jgi:hypothetical protein
MDNLYRVRWEIDVYDESPEKAAKQALGIQQDPGNIATWFEVQELEEDRNLSPVGSPLLIDAAFE